MKELFDFITDPTVTEDNMDDYLDRVSDRVANNANEEVDPERQVEEGVFKSAYIPQRLAQVRYRSVQINSNKIETVIFIYRLMVIFLFLHSKLQRFILLNHIVK